MSNPLVSVSVSHSWANYRKKSLNCYLSKSREYLFGTLILLYFLIPTIPQVSNVGIFSVGLYTRHCMGNILQGAGSFSVTISHASPQLPCQLPIVLKMKRSKDKFAQDEISLPVQNVMLKAHMLIHLPPRQQILCLRECLKQSF